MRRLQFPEDGGGWFEMLERSERSALRQLTRRELPGLYALARRLGGADPEDMVQETLLRACRSFRSLRDGQAGRKWLRVILTNVWRDLLRKADRAPTEVPIGDEALLSVTGMPGAEEALPDAESFHIDTLGPFSERDVHVVLGRLPHRYRAPLALRYLVGFSTGEVADILGRPRGTVLSQMHRGRQRFARELRGYAAECGLLDDAGDERTS